MKRIISVYLLLLFVFGFVISGCVFSVDENPVKSTEGYNVSEPLPAVNETGLNIILTLEWNSQDGDNFDVYLDTANPPIDKIASNIASKNFNVAGLQYGTTYYWRVVSITPEKNELIGPVWSFTTKPGAGGVVGPGNVLNAFEISAEQPNYVNLLFQVLDLSGKGVTNLSTSDFEVFENGEPISPFESQLIISKRDQNENYLQRTVLMLDNSTSLDQNDLDEIKKAAINFVNNLTSNHEVAVYKFSQDPVLIVDFTDNKGLLIAAINSLSPGFPTTNLYGAIVVGASRWTDSFSLNRILKGSMIVFTDGKDTQGSSSLDQARTATQNKIVYTVGLGVDVDPDILELIGTAGFVSIANADELSQVFIEINNEIILTSDSFYWLRYSSPKRGNNNHRLQVRITGNPINSIIEKEFNSGSFYSASPGLYINPSKDRPEGIIFTSMIKGTEITLKAFLVGYTTLPQFVWEEVNDTNNLITITPVEGTNNSEVKVKAALTAGTAVIRVSDQANGIMSNNLTINIQ
ncbi:MAG: VWA domain-containing protein [Bacteroidetes bacterium]|nr:VWA domain-containing protein [Bacteroidota bacterium]